MEAQWKPISTAPKDGRLVELGWLPNGRVEHTVKSRWRSGDGWLSADGVYEWQQPCLAELDESDGSPLAECERVTFKSV
jgi:hypothetical protein